MASLKTATFKGTFDQRGEQHGSQFGPDIHKSGLIDFYHGYAEKELLAEAPAFAKPVLRLLHTLCGSRLSPGSRAIVKGFCRGSGFEEARILRSAAMPDIFNFMIGVGARVAPVLGCTSAAAWGDYSKDGKFRYGRNLDFPGNGIYDQNPLVCRHTPDVGIPYVSVGTAGSILDGITALNEEGLSVALQQHISTDIGILRDGRPILDLATQIAQFAPSIDAAIKLCEGFKTTSGWTVVLTHWKERRACVVEMTPRRFSVRKFEDGKFSRTNDFLDPTLKQDEIDLPAWRESSRIRSHRADQILEENKGKVDAAVLAGLLGDHMDVERGRVRAFAQVIAQANNMTSVVFEPEDGVMWVADGPSPVCDQPYRRVELWTDKAPGAPLQRRGHGMSDTVNHAYGLYLEGFTAWQKHRDDATALARLNQTVTADPHEPVYRYIQGIMRLRHGALEAALESFGEGAALPDYHHRSEAQKLWQGRALDMLGRRHEASAIYRDLSETPRIKPSVKRAAQKGLAKPYAGKNHKRLAPDFFLGDVYTY